MRFPVKVVQNTTRQVAMIPANILSEFVPGASTPAVNKILRTALKIKRDILSNLGGNVPADMVRIFTNHSPK